MKEYQIICIDDDEQFLSSLAGSLPGRVESLCPDFKCFFEFVASSEELFRMLTEPEERPSLAMVISDQMMPGTSGIELIEKLKSEYPDMVSMLLTGHGGMDSAAYAINHHLLDQYVSKPIEDLQEFASMVANLLKRHYLNLEEQERTAQLAATVEELRISNERIRAMQVAAEQVAMLSKGLKSLNFEEVVELVSYEVPKIFQAERRVLYFVRDGCPIELVRRGDCPCPQPSLFSRVDAQQAVRDGEIRCGDVPDVCAELGGRSAHVVVPLVVTNVSSNHDQGEEDWRGYLCMCGMDSTAADSSDLMKYKAGLVSEILSVSLTNARLYQQAKKDSQTDPLTGVNTRRVLEEKLEAEHDRAVRYKRPFCVAIVDIDRFKAINDMSGHVVGDQALRHLADILHQEIRKNDILARYGGDEFVVLMPETDLDDAVNAAERMRQKVESNLVMFDQSVTISCGVAVWSGKGHETGTDMLRRADAALYEAKRTGRNRIEIAKAA
ncbi:MAG: diguanylate cyclase [Planctomycetota bacterium]|nr:diguanylate cyclase [Planctomycetota bacterium]